MTPDQYAEYKRWTSALLRVTGWSDFMRLGAFDAIRKHVRHDQVYYALLGFVWPMVERPHLEAHLNHRAFYPRKRKRHFEFLMEPDDLAVLAALPDLVAVYRGVSGGPYPGWSWTLSQTQAAWFARRWSSITGPAYLLTGRVARQRIIAYDNGRGEAEIIVDPRWVDLEETRLIEAAGGESGAIVGRHAA
jgi:hypothetical protein